MGRGSGGQELQAGGAFKDEGQVPGRGPPWGTGSAHWACQLCEWEQARPASARSRQDGREPGAPPDLPERMRRQCRAVVPAPPRPPCAALRVGFLAALSRAGGGHASLASCHVHVLPTRPLLTLPQASQPAGLSLRKGFSRCRRLEMSWRRTARCGNSLCSECEGHPGKSLGR